MRNYGESEERLYNFIKNYLKAFGIWVKILCNNNIILWDNTIWKIIIICNNYYGFYGTLFG